MKTPATSPPAVSNRELLRLAVPAMVALAAEPLYMIADAAMVARLGTEALAALAVSTAIIGTAVWLFNFLVYGTTSEVGRLVGAGEDDRIADYLVQAVLVAVGVGLALTALGLTFARPLHRLMGAAPEVIEAGLPYYRVRVWGAPVVLAGLVGMGALRGLQNTRLPMVASVGTSLLNIALDYLLIFGVEGWIPAMGIRGAALATLVSEITWGLAMFVALWGFAAYRHTRPRRLAFERATMGKILRVSRDLLLRTGTLMMTYNVATALAGRIGTAQLAAHEIGLKLWLLGAFILDGFAIAGQAVVAKELGARRAASAREATTTLVRWGAVVGCVLMLVYAATRDGWIGLFRPEPAVRAEILALSLWVIALQPLNAIVFVLDGVLIGAGDLRFLRNAMFAACGLFAPMAAVVYALDLGLPGLWTALGGMVAVRLLTNVWRFLGDGWTGGSQPTDAPRAAEAA